MKKASSLVLIALLSVSVGCTSMKKVLPERRERVGVEEMQELRRRIAELQERTTMNEVEVERLRRQVAELEQENEGLRQGDGPPSSTLPVTGVAQSPDRAPGDPAAGALQPAIIEETELEVDDIDLVSGSEASESGPVDPAPVPVATESGTVSREPSATVTENGQALYDRGYTLFHRGKYLDAETVFQQFLADFSDTELADNAQFWIGEARYARRDLSGAMAAFREVVNRHPEGNKVPDAHLKVADCQRGLGDVEGARRSYQAVIERYPFAAAAAVAEDRLKETP